MKPTVNSYFSGAGLLDLGLQRAGLAVQQSCEIDATCCATLRANFKHHVVEGDIKNKLVAEEADCDVMVATYPCNRYSAIGDIHGVRTGDDLYLHFFRHLAIRRPEVYALENVPGMKKFPVVMEAMTKLPDYYVQVFCPVSSQNWLPQKRDRLIIIGSRRHFAWRAPKSGHAITLRQILERDPQIQVPRYVAKRLRGGYRDLPIISDPARGDIAPTCVAHYAKDLSTRLVVDKRFKRGVRPYTVREYARLQGVPDDFVFVGGEPSLQDDRQWGLGTSRCVARQGVAEVFQMTATRRRQQNNAAARRYRRRLVAAGLTYRGTNRIYRRWTELGALRGQQRQTERQRRRRAEYIEAGLNNRGQERIRTPRPELNRLRGQEKHNALCRILRREKRVSPLESAYREFRSTIAA